VVEGGTALVADAEADSRVLDVSDSMGEYVNMGTCWLVALVVLFSTAAIVLDNTAETIPLEEGVATLWIADVSGVDIAEGLVNMLELSSIVGVGVDIMYEVDKMVSGSPVTSGVPSGLTKVTAGAIEVNIVCWMGSTMIAVSASTDGSVGLRRSALDAAEGSTEGRVVDGMIAASVGVSVDDEATWRTSLSGEAEDVELAWCARLHFVSHVLFGFSSNNLQLPPVVLGNWSSH
jgi:hypothetical protein